MAVSFTALLLPDPLSPTGHCLIHMMPPSERERILEDARSVSQRLWRIARLAQDAAESLDEQIEDEDLTGVEEAVEMRDVLERVQALSIEVSEELDAYQTRHAR
jgi:hypothetical protein